MSLLPYKRDDGGRAAAGFKGGTGDCLVRAMAIASGQPYREVYAHVAATYKVHGYKRTGNAYYMGRKSKRGQLTPKKAQDRALMDMGFTKVPLLPGPRPTYTEVARVHGTAVVGTTKHIGVIRDGVYRDTFDDRTYEWFGDTNERKAVSIWLPPTSGGTIATYTLRR